MIGSTQSSLLTAFQSPFNYIFLFWYWWCHLMPSQACSMAHNIYRIYQLNVLIMIGCQATFSAVAWRYACLLFACMCLCVYVCVSVCVCLWSVYRLHRLTWKVVIVSFTFFSFGFIPPFQYSHCIIWMWNDVISMYIYSNSRWYFTIWY